MSQEEAEGRIEQFLDAPLNLDKMKVLWYQLTSPQLQRRELPRRIQETSTPALETRI